MTQDVLEKFFSDSAIHLGQSQPQAASSLFPFSRLARQEGSRSLPSGSLPPPHQKKIRPDEKAGGLMTAAWEAINCRQRQ